MLNHLKQYGTLHLVWIAGLLACIGQESSHYMTGHPKASFEGLLGALAMAVINFYVKSPFSKP